jgi:hypothetical protein
MEKAKAIQKPKQGMQMKKKKLWETFSPTFSRHLERIEQKLDVYSLATIPFIEEVKLKQFALAASSDRSIRQ